VQANVQQLLGKTTRSVDGGCVRYLLLFLFVFFFFPKMMFQLSL
jgi:hypothetical protein